MDLPPEHRAKKTVLKVMCSALKSTRSLWHLFVEMKQSGPFLQRLQSLIWLRLFEEPRFVLPLPQRPCSLINEALGARHGDIGSTDSCTEFD